MSTRAHILDETVNHARIPGDPTAIPCNLMVDLAGRPFDRLSPREARQLAWALCEAADKAEAGVNCDPPM